MTKTEILSELMNIYLAGNGKMTLKEARDKAEAKFESAKVFYKKCGYLKEPDGEPAVLPRSWRDRLGMHSGDTSSED